MVVFNNAMAGAAGSGGAAGYTIDNSLRFNPTDSAFLNKTLSASGDRKTWTFSCWVKRSSLGASYDGIFSTTDSSGLNGVYIDFTSDYFQVGEYGGSSWTWILQTNARYRDVSAWYHIVVAVDTTQSTASDRVKIWINGERITEFYSGLETYPTLDYLTLFNDARYHAIGRLGAYTGGYYFPGYMAEMYFIDGQALTATDFGAFDADTGVWNPIEYTGTYGTNGFYLPFSDNSSASALGTDASGIGNNWTVNNISHTPGSPSTGYDDNGGTPYWIDILPKNANFSYSAGAGYLRRVTDGDEATHVYWTGTTGTSGNVYDIKFDLRDFPSITSLRLHYNWSGYSGSYDPYSAELLDANKQLISGTKLTLDHGGASAATKAWESMTVSGTPRYLRIYADPLTSQTRLQLYQIEINGTSLNSTAYSGGSSSATAYPDGDLVQDSPTNGDNTLDTGLGGELPGNYCTWNPLFAPVSGGHTFRNGNLDVTTSTSYYRPVVGSLFTPAGKGKWYFEVEIKATVGIAYHMIGAMSSDNFVDNTYQGAAGLNNVYRGFSAYVGSNGITYITSDLGNAGSSTGFASDGDVVGVAIDADNGTVRYYINGVAQGTGFQFTGLNPNVGWTPSVSAYNAVANQYTLNTGQRPFAFKPPAGFKCICTANFEDPAILNGDTGMGATAFLGTGLAQTIDVPEHSPDLVWAKSRTNAYSNLLFDRIRGDNQALKTDQADIEADFSPDYVGFRTDNAFDINGGATWINANATSSVAWTWDAGTANTTVTAGSLSASIYDDSADWFTGSTVSNISNYAYLWDGLLTTEATVSANPGTWTYSINGVTSLRLYMKASGNSSITLNGNSATTVETPVINAWRWVDVSHKLSIIGNNLTSVSIAQLTATGPNIRAIEVNGKILVNNSATTPTAPNSASTYRANPDTGFSIVSYTGNGLLPTGIAHGLGKQPEFIIVKNLTTAYNWAVMHQPLCDSLGDDRYYTLLNSTNPYALTNTRFGGVKPSKDLFYVGSAADTNASGADYIAYVWAQIPGYSKIGVYEANGLTDGPFIECGFRPQFIMVKRANGVGPWVLWDDVRPGYNDDNALLYPTYYNAEAAGTYLDILSTGFKLRTTGTSYNSSGDEFIYLAFASNPIKYARAN